MVAKNGNWRSGRRFLQQRSQLAHGLQVAFAHGVNKPWVRHIGDGHQSKVTVLAVKQATAGRLIEVLEPVGANDHRLRQGGLEEVAVGRAAILFPRQLQRPRPERPAIARAELELGHTSTGLSNSARRAKS